MPIYVYRCLKCDNLFDVLATMEAPAPPCPRCEGLTKKQVTGGNFNLKGNGWYRDGYGLHEGKKNETDTD